MSTEITQTKYGPMMVNPHDTYMGRSLMEYGEYSPGEQHFYAEVLKPGMTVIEAGACFGVNTIPLAQFVGPNGRVFSFEPQRISYQMLCGNLALNNLTNVHAFNVALGSEPGVAQIAQLNPDVENNLGGLRVHDGMVGNIMREPVPIMRLDDVIPEGHIVHLLQLDAEGMEPDILVGATRIIAESRPILYLEANQQEPRTVLLKWLEDNSYKAWDHIPQMYEEGNWKQSTTLVWPENIVSFNLICLPSEKVQVEA